MTNRGFTRYAGASGVTATPVGTNSSAFTTAPLVANTKYWVRVSNGSGSVDSAAALATIAFTDATLTAGSTTAKAVHIVELRARVNALRTRFGLPSYPFADSSIVGGATTIKAVHLSDLRQALAEAYTAAGQSPPTYTDPALAAGTPIKAVHINELRNAVMLLEP